MILLLSVYADSYIGQIIEITAFEFVLSSIYQLNWIEPVSFLRVREDKRTLFYTFVQNLGLYVIKHVRAEWRRRHREAKNLWLLLPKLISAEIMTFTQNLKNNDNKYIFTPKLLHLASGTKSDGNHYFPLTSILAFDPPLTPNSTSSHGVPLIAFLSGMSGS